jgi:RNA polymerase sigma-70 factor (ECF subfamily)
MSFIVKQDRLPQGGGRPSAWAVIWEWLARPMHYRAVRAMRVAAQNGDASALESLLDPAISVVVDSGDTRQPTVRVVSGARDASALLLHGMAGNPGQTIVERSVNNQAGLMLSRDDEVVASMTVDFTGALISLIWIRLHPELQRHWNTVLAA